MKKITAIILSLLLSMTLLAGMTVSSSAYYADMPQYLRLGIKSISAGSSFSISSEGGFKIYNYNSDGSCSGVADISASSVTVAAGASDIVITGEGGATLYTYPNDGTKFIGCSNLSNGIFLESGTSYRGGIMLCKTSSAYTFINVIDTEKYLYGVLPKEMSTSYPLEALKAQAVAARTYVAGNVGKHKAKGYDLCTTTECQAYGGVIIETPKCTSAVVGTEGMMVYYGGEPVSTCVYSANNGGYIEASKDIWGGDLPYLQGKADPYNPENAWTVDFSKETLQTKLSAAGYNIGTLTGVNILSQTAGGSVTALEFTGTAGSKVLYKTSIRSFLGLKSLHFTIAKSEFSGVSSFASESNKRHVINSISSMEKALIGLHIIDGNGNVIQIDSNSKLSVQSAAGKSALQITATVTNTGGDDVDGIVVSGKGYGHGIGMSQTGAKAMAEAGFEFKDILTFYYTGVEIK